MASQLRVPENSELSIPPGITPKAALRSAPPKKLLRRAEKDHSQLYRQCFQGAFLLLNLWLGLKFYFWVRQFEVGTFTGSLQRPAGVEGWLPIAGLMNLKYWLLGGQIPACASRRHVSFAHLPRHGFPISQSLLQLALPHRHTLRISLACRPQTLWPQFLSAALARPPIPRPQVFPPGAFRMGHLNHVRGRYSRLHVQPLRLNRRREDAQFLSPHR